MIVQDKTKLTHWAHCLFQFLWLLLHLYLLIYGVEH